MYLLLLNYFIYKINLVDILEYIKQLFCLKSLIFPNIILIKKYLFFSNKNINLKKRLIIYERNKNKIRKY